MEAMRLGAEEYLVRPLMEQQVETALRRSLSIDANSEHLTEEIEQIADDLFFVAADNSMPKLRVQLDLLAQVSTTFLIDDENRTVKELAAREVHRLPVRSQPRCLTVHCAAL